MPEVELILVSGRIIERIIVVFGAIAAMYFGWNLFKSGVIISQNASGEYGKAKIVLGKVGPGIFFGLFSTAVLGFALTSPLKVERPTPQTTKPPTEASSQPDRAKTAYSYITGDQSAETIKAINALIEATKNSNDSRIKQAISTINSIKLAILVQRFSVDDLSFYAKNKGDIHINPTKFSPSDRERLKKIDEIASAEFDEKL